MIITSSTCCSSSTCDINTTNQKETMTESNSENHSKDNTTALTTNHTITAVTAKTNDNPTMTETTTAATCSSNSNSSTRSSSRASSPQNSVYSSASSSSSSSSSSLCQEKDIPVASLLPSYLQGFVQHSHDDFFVSPYFDPQLLAQLMCEGFLPISTSRYLLPKLHEERCVIYPLQQLHSPSTNTHTMNTTTNNTKTIIHTSKSTKKKLKKFTFTINQDFDGVVKGCHNQHGVAWLYPNIVASFKYIHELSKHTNSILATENDDRQGKGIVARIIPSNFTRETTSTSESSSTTTTTTTSNNNKHSTPFFQTCQVKLYSIEVWNAQTGELAGGELGYTIGSIYTSLTGFSSQDSAGSVQLATLGKLLCLNGYEMWDLGMSLDYKISLGAKMMKRMDFIRCVKEMRVKSPYHCASGSNRSKISSCSSGGTAATTTTAATAAAACSTSCVERFELKCDEKMNCKEIFDMDEWIH